MITCEIDQFLCVDCFAFSSIRSYFKVIDDYSYLARDIMCIPKEMFNMVHIQVINFSYFINYTGKAIKLSSLISDNSCNWSNLINLRTVYNIPSNLYVEHNNLIKVLKK